MRSIDPFKGKWVFPGGFMKIDETAEECARRELEVKFDRRNFYNKMLKLGILSEAEPRPVNASRRTPTKYRFNAEKYAELKQKGLRLVFKL